MRKLYYLIIVVLISMNIGNAQAIVVDIKDVSGTNPKNIVQIPYIVINLEDNTIDITFSTSNDMFTLSIESISSGVIEFEMIVISFTISQRFLMPLLQDSSYRITIFNKSKQYLGYFEL